jgi:hypothetical protein
MTIARDATLRFGTLPLAGVGDVPDALRELLAMRTRMGRNHTKEEEK